MILVAGQRRPARTAGASLPLMRPSVSTKWKGVHHGQSAAGDVVAMVVNCPHRVGVSPLVLEDVERNGAAGAKGVQAARVDGGAGNREAPRRWHTAGVGRAAAWVGRAAGGRDVAGEL